ncbi:peptidase S74 [Bacillus cereus]|uniref:Peptidase S74 n=1 Tax=Bacillus cereus TaxID=1396 RepID=A0A9X6UIY9_BACCE|nr:phage tail spike protein [Bacillus cereus]PEQ84178.1 peptidase S74 [Bacillus cereus]PET50521.1 peptidase S74 [Bacillus cereus]PFL86578.1 peptidase S74 [Bacillus cereus]
MRKVSGDLHIVDFKTKQIIASIQPEDYLDDLRHWEIKDNVDILDFKLLEDSPFLDYIQQKNLILKETNPGVITPYVITSIEKDSEAHNVTIYASGEWILLDKENYIKPQEIKSWSAEQYLTLGITGTGWEIGLIEAEGKRSFKIEKFISPLQFIQQIATLFDNIEIQYRMEIGTGKPRRFIDLVKKRGRETNKEVTLGKDLVGIKRIENSENIITALVPYYIGQDADGNDKLITIESVNNGSQYIVDDAAFQRWNVNGKHLFGFYTPESEKDELTPARLLTLAKTELKKRVSAIVTYEVNSIDISSVFGYEHEDVSEGDTIRIIDEGMTPTLYLEARAIAGDESHKDKHQNKHTFGNFVEIVDQDEALRKLYQKMLSMINDKVSKEWFAALEEKANDATKKANEAVEESQSAKDLANATKDYMDQNMVDIIEQPIAPTENLRDGKTLWIDSSDPENKVQKLWKDGQWQRVTPDTGPLQQSIKDAQIEINTLKNTVKDLPDTTWINQQLEDKADKSGVYNRDYIDQNLVGKQVYETDKQGNIQKFTDMKTEINQNAEAITHKAEKTQVDTISNNLNQVTQTANTAKQTAESNTNTISSLQTTVSNINDNVTNLLVDSGTFEGAKITTPAATDRWWFKNNNLVRLSADTYQGNAVIETQTAWNSLAYNFKDLIDRGVVKAGDKVNYSVSVRVKNLANGQSAQQNFYFRTGATGIRPPNATNQWQRVSVSFTVTPDMMTVTGTSTDSFMRIEPDVAQTGTVWYQQSTPQLTIGDKVYTWRPAPEDNATFVKKSNEIKQTVDSNVATIQSIQKDQGSMQSTLNEVKQTTDSNSQTIATLSQTQGQQGAIIQQNTSDISQLNNQIKSKVSDTQMQEYVGGLGSTNVLFNAAFEDRVINAATGAVTSRTPSTTKWSVVGTGSGITIVPESARHHEGYNSVKITATGQTASKWSGIMQRVPAVQNGGDYVFSAWVYVQDKNTLDNGGAIKLQFFNGANAVSTFVQTEFKDLLVNNSWILVSVKITSPNVAITHLQGDIWVRQNGTIWVSQPQLQQGSTRSTFMENPKDYANYDQLVGEIGKKVATSDFNSKVSTIETSINQQSNRIDLKAEKNDVYNKVDSDGRYGSKAIVESHTSQLSVMSNEINLRVKSGEIASAINQTAQSVLIQANKIMLDGFIEAKHLKAQELVGVTIKTAPNTENRYVKLNRQFLELYDKDTSRIQLQFFNSNYTSAITPGLVLGKSATKGLVGASAFYHFTFLDSNGNETGASSQSAIGIVGSVDSNNAFNYASQVRFFETGSINIHGDNNIWIKSSKNGWIDIETDSVGSAQPISIKASSSVQITAGTSIVTNSNTFHRFTGNGVFNFVRNGAPSGQNQTSLEDDGNNADLRLAFVRIRSSHVSGYSGRIQLVPTGESTPTAGLEAGNISYTSLTNRSSRTIKANIRDLEIDSLEKIMGLKVQQYNFKSDVEKLYQMREGAVGTDKVYTTADIPLQYGLVLEDTDETFHSDLGDGINLYTLVSLNVDSTQKIKCTQDIHEEELSNLKSKVASQEERIAKLEELLLQQLIIRKTEQL